MKRILLIDDNDDYLEILKLVLGKKYLISSSTAEGVEKIIADFEPDLIIIDHFLGLYNTENILQAFRSSKFKKAIPFILFSGVHDIEKRAAELGATGYMGKPSSVDYIRKYIDDFFKYRY